MMIKLFAMQSKVLRVISMIDELFQEIKDILLKHKVHIGNPTSYVAYLIHLKYLCEENVYSFEEVVSNDFVYPLNKETRRILKFNEGLKLPINKLLFNVRNLSSKELLEEFLNTLEKPLYLHQNYDSIAYLEIESNLYEYYNPFGNATYIMRMSEYYETFQIFDKILNIQNHYVLFDDAKNNIKSYHFDYLYIYDNTLRFRKTSDDLLEEIQKFFPIMNHVILMARYSKISNFREGRFLTKYIKTIILDNKRAIIHFQKEKDNEEITIINTDSVKDKSKLLSIIKNNRKQKDVLLKITHQDIRDNNYRIGFHLYTLEKTNKIKDINKIVDENTNYLEQLNRINQTVEVEINRLLNR